MDFLFTDEQSAVQELVKDFLSKEISAEGVRKVLGRKELIDPTDRKLWEKFAALGVFSAVLPESHGGLGAGILSAVACLEASQQPINHLPIFQTLSQALLLSLLPANQGVQKLCDELTQGRSFVTGSCVQNSSDLPKEFVPIAGGTETDLFVLGVVQGNNLSISTFAKNAFTVRPLETLDLLCNYSAFLLYQGEMLAKDLPTEIFHRWQQGMQILAAAELVGIAKTVIQQTLDYVKTREQFGRPVGTFQAIQHKLADMHLAAEQAQSLTRFAAWCFDTNDPQGPSAAQAAKMFASQITPKVVEDAIQAHGGIGFTFEHDLHLYLRRSKVLAALYGEVSELATVLADEFLMETGNM